MSDIQEIPLSSEERKKIRQAIMGRILLFIFGLLPLFTAIIALCYMAGKSFIDGDADLFSYLVPIASCLFFWGVYHYILPQYRNLFRYARAKHKQVIPTRVLSVHMRNTSRVPFFNIQTDAHIWINTGKNVIFFMDIPALEIKEGMFLKLHILPGMENEFLRISPGEEVILKA